MRNCTPRRNKQVTVLLMYCYLTLRSSFHFICSLWIPSTLLLSCSCYMHHRPESLIHRLQNWSSFCSTYRYVLEEIPVLKIADHRNNPWPTADYSSQVASTKLLPIRLGQILSQVNIRRKFSTSQLLCPKHKVILVTAACRIRKLRPIDLQPHCPATEPASIINSTQSLSPNALFVTLLRAIEEYGGNKTRCGCATRPWPAALSAKSTRTLHAAKARSIKASSSWSKFPAQARMGRRNPPRMIVIVIC